ncbi:MAG: GGDEF domain-containing protein [Actinobacteria bacterium]|nr:MAG: GGDEF domain-containing protein [Actinomycetota bacterium]
MIQALAEAIEQEAWQLAVATVEEGLTDDQLPSLQRLGRLGQLGDMPTFIGELARGLVEPSQERLRIGSPLAAQARDHAREREALGFAPREIVTEFLLLRRVLWRFVSERAAELDAGEDRLVTECVVAYFDRATSELAHEARHDQLTGLLHHHAFLGELEAEVERAGRYGHELALVFFDLDDFKDVNDTLGHQAGDRVLQSFAGALRGSLRASDLAGRMGGDEFAAYLLEADDEAGTRLIARLHERLKELGDPSEVSFSAGTAHYPDDAVDVDGLFRRADERLYSAKRASAT